MANLVLEMKNIKKSYYGTTVLHDISLKLNEGEIVGFVGENGAGKSTLMNILFGDEVISNTGGYEGEIFIDGKKVTIDSSFEHITQQSSHNYMDLPTKVHKTHRSHSKILLFLF